MCCPRKRLRESSIHSISACVTLLQTSPKSIANDSINAAIKRLSIEEEHSGFELKKLSLKVIGNDQRMKIENFAIDLPNTSLAMDTIHMDYDSLGRLTILPKMSVSHSICCPLKSPCRIYRLLFRLLVPSRKNCK